MLADIQILSLPKVSLETKEMLPEYSGIYYVIDESNTVWYIGKAKNIRKRWLGKSHHRIYQLKIQKQKHFSIYYEQVNYSQLDKIEKQKIKKYTPHLNNSPVKNKKVRPTETLLQETIVTISDFAFVLGVEPPRREFKEQIGTGLLTQEKALDSSIICIALDMTAFKSILNVQSGDQHEALIKNAFSTRKAYASKWQGLPKVYPFFFRLNVNGYIVEVTHVGFWIGNNPLEKPIRYNQATIANESIRVLTPESLHELQNYTFESQNKKFQLQRLNPYTSDLIPVIFNESIDRKTVKQKLFTLSKDYQTGKRGLGSRSHPIKSKPINADFTTIDELLLSRGIEPNKYNNGNVISMNRGGQDRIGLYIKFFNINLEKIYYFQQTIKYQTFLLRQSIYGMLNNSLVCAPIQQFNAIYLLTGVDKKGWLLVEEYLKDFAKISTKLDNGESAAEKFYVSPRKFIAPAKVNIKLENMKYSAWIPFGMNKKYPSFEAAKTEIKRRLNEANLPDLKLTFRREHITK